LSLAAPRLPRRAAAALVAASAVAAVVLPWAVRPWQSGPGWTQAVALVFTVLMVSAFAEAIRANTALVEARAEVARLASEAERARIARDLHDLLGHSLTAITVKSTLARRLVTAEATRAGEEMSAVETLARQALEAERARIARDLHDLLGHSLTAITVKSTLARRLVTAEATRAGEEMSAVETLARQALTDVRAAVSGYREVTLAVELARGRELLRACGVAADLPTATDVVAPDRQELFGWVVREGLTNVARHARATRCTVTLSAASVEVADDGGGGPAPHGSGLDGLRERVEAA
ncbi:sensor histidine kinase, partial [Amycolatopsis vancoresmycina]